MAKNPCPASRSQFRTAAPKFLTVTIGSQTFTMPLKAEGFETGSEGYNLSAKGTLDVAGIPVPMQLGINYTAIGSKELPKLAAGTSVAKAS